MYQKKKWLKWEQHCSSIYQTKKGSSKNKDEDRKKIGRKEYKILFT